ATLKPEHRRTKRHPQRPTVREHRMQRDDYCRLLAGLPWALTPDEYGRLHSPLTRLERELRDCLTLAGEPLTRTDLKNSQPLIMGMMAGDWLTGTKQARGRLCHRQFIVKNPYHAMDKHLSASKHGKGRDHTATSTTQTTKQHMHYYQDLEILSDSGDE